MPFDPSTALAQVWGLWPLALAGIAGYLFAFITHSGRDFLSDGR